MPSRHHVARDISYAHSAETRGGRMLIKVDGKHDRPNASDPRADGYDQEVAQGRDFWSVMVDRYGLTLDVVGGALSNIPKDGPLILIANHPYGILDGLMMGHILSQTRGDFRLLANHVFRKAEDLNRIVLPISFDATKEAMKLNLETRKTALNYLSDGGAIGIFSRVALSARRSNRFRIRWIRAGAGLRRGWLPNRMRLLCRCSSTVTPRACFRLPAICTTHCGWGLLIKEFKKRVDTPVRVVVGEPIGRDILDPLGKDTRKMMDFLRKATYELSPEPLKSYDYGYEFEERHRA